VTAAVTAVTSNPAAYDGPEASRGGGGGGGWGGGIGFNPVSRMSNTASSRGCCGGDGYVRIIPYDTDVTGLP
jgi:hypothetical protein